MSNPKHGNPTHTKPAPDPAWMSEPRWIVEARPHYDAPHDGANLTHWTHHAEQITNIRTRKHHKDRGVKFYGYREAEAEANRANRSQKMDKHLEIIVEALLYLADEAQAIAEQRESEGEDATEQRNRIAECQSALDTADSF